MEIHIYQVDAFTDKAFGGNPAGVVPDAKGLTDMDMQNIAKEMNLSETAFIIPIDSDNYKVRFFTPVSEVDLCGHATIAAFYTLAAKGYISPIENGIKKVYQNTRVGKLAVEIFFHNGKIEKVLMEQAMPQELNKIKDIDPLLECLNIQAEDIGIEGKFIYPKIISTGLPDIILPLKDKEVLNNLNVDFKKLYLLSKKLGVTGIHVFYLPNKNSGKVFTRNFAPLVGINEEAATGTSNGALIYFLKKEGYLDNNKIISFQGESLNRPSKIYCEIEKTRKGYMVKVGGQAKIVLDGTILI